MKKYKLLILGLLLASVSFGQTDSLGYYLRTAALNNPSIQQKWSEYKASLQKVPQVSSLPDPDLNLGFFLKPMELLGGNQVADLQLMQMFPWFGVLKNAKDEMSLMANAAFASVNDAKLQVYYEVRSSWYQLFLNREQVRIMQQNLELVHQIQRLVTSRYKTGGIGNSASASFSSGSSAASSNSANTGGNDMNGMSGNGNSATPTKAPAPMASPSMNSTAGGGLSDVYSLQLEEYELLDNIASLNDNYRNMTFKFNKLLNRSVDRSVELPDKLQVDSLPLPLDSSLKNNPMLVMLEFERKSLEARRKMSERMGYPMVGIGLKYSILSKNPASTSMMNGQDMLMPMFSVSLPVYRKKYKAIQQETEWQKTASEQNYESTLNRLQTEYQDALFSFRDAQRRIQLYERQRLLTDKSYQLLLKRFAASTISLTEIQSLSRQLLDYSLKSLNAKVDLLLAQAKLRQLTAQDE
ncbi:MAG TPA: TolC family protein [Bacteroidales bacterium]|nr:TolC family protein [Bacteroidales bacterium]